jgi:hypothetical protein
VRKTPLVSAFSLRCPGEEGPGHRSPVDRLGESAPRAMSCSTSRESNRRDFPSLIERSLPWTVHFRIVAGLTLRRCATSRQVRSGGGAPGECVERLWPTSYSTPEVYAARRTCGFRTPRRVGKVPPPCRRVGAKPVAAPYGGREIGGPCGRLIPTAAATDALRYEGASAEAPSLLTRGRSLREAGRHPSARIETCVTIAPRG